MDPAHPLSGMLLALRASDGHQLWRTEIGTLASQPLVAGPTIYVSAEHLVSSSGFLKEVYALNRSDGSVRWQTEIPNTRTISDALTLSQDHLVLSASQLCFDACNAAYLMALDAQSGHLAWQLSFSGNVTIQPPVVDGDIVYAHIPGYDPGFYAFRVTDGRQLWQGRVGTYVVSHGIVYTDKVLTAPDPARSDLWHYAVAALDGQTGAERWETSTVIYPAVVAVAGEQVIVKSETPNPKASQTTSPYRDVITALRARDGKPLWSAQQDAYFTGITVASDTVYLTLPATRYGEQAYVAARHLSDGHALWQQRLGPAHPPDGSSLVGIGFVDPSDNLLCSVSADILYGVRTSDGRTLWNADLTASGQLAGTTVVM